MRGMREGWGEWGRGEGRGKVCHNYQLRGSVGLVRVVSNLLSDCFGSASLRHVIGSWNSRHPFNQSDSKLKPIATWSPTFPAHWTVCLFFFFASALAFYINLLCLHWLFEILWFWFYSTQLNCSFSCMHAFDRQNIDRRKYLLKFFKVLMSILIAHNLLH